MEGAETLYSRRAAAAVIRTRLEGQSAAVAALFIYGTRSTLPNLWDQKHLADIPAVLNEVMRLRRFLEPEAAGDLRLHHALRP
jgi:hypothetical protein